MNLKITEKQKKVLEIIYNSIITEGFPPSLANLRESLNLASNQAVLNYLNSLEEKGFIQREEGQARGIKITPLGLKTIGKERLAPIVGFAAAGPYIESFTDINFKWVDLPSGVVPNEKIKQSEDVFIVHVAGDSMINAGIDDGNMLLVRKTKEFKSGDIVVARSDDGFTVKRFVAKDGRVYLKPENPAYKNIMISPETSLEGKVILNLSKIK